MLSRLMARMGISILLIAGACAMALSSPSAGGQDPGDSAVRPDVATAGDLEALIRLYRTERADVERFHDLPWSELRFDRLARMYRAWQERLGRVEFDGLNQQGRIDYVLLRNHLSARLSQLDRDRRRLAEMDGLLPFRAAVLELDTARREMKPVDAQASAALLAPIPEQLKELRERMERGKKQPTTQPTAPPGTSNQDSVGGGAATTATASQQVAALPVSPVQAKRTAAAVENLRRPLREWFNFYEGYQPGFSWWVKKPYEEADRALAEYAKYLRESVAGLKGKDDDPLIGDPLGPAALAVELEYEMIPYTPAQLIAIGQREFAWCEAEMKRAAAELGFGDDWQAALARVKQNHVPPGEQDDLVAVQAREAIAFVKARDLVTVPPLCRETWRVKMIAPDMQRTHPFAAYGGQKILVAYPTDAMKHDDKIMSMRGNNRHTSRIVVAHELIPGHHLQAYMARRHRSYRLSFSTAFFIEGWALHWEMLLWDLGFAATPEDRIGMLFWRMHRCARIIVSLKFHLNEMTPAEMVDYLVDRVGLEPFAATSEVRRYIGDEYGPLYQCAYMIGGLQLRALHQELVGSGRMTDREFHDTVLTYNVIPFELIRAGMLNLPLTPDAQSTWDFAGKRPPK